MTVDIFIRTYHKDLRWLDYALKSIHKYVSGYRSIIVAIPDARLLSHLTAEKVIQCEDLADGYIGQQFTKMTAHLHTDADAVIFWDSDVIAFESVDVSEWIVDGKPLIWKTKYEQTETPWKPITEKALGFAVEWEYMRRMPLTYLTRTLRETCKYMEGLHGMPLRDYLNQCPHRSFSEFNAIGAFAEKYESQLYDFRDTETGALPPNKVDQMWSWSGLNASDLKKINQYLK